MAFLLPLPPAPNELIISTVDKTLGFYGRSQLRHGVIRFPLLVCSFTSINVRGERKRQSPSLPLWQRQHWRSLKAPLASVSGSSQLRSVLACTGGVRRLHRMKLLEVDSHWLNWWIKPNFPPWRINPPVWWVWHFSKFFCNCTYLFFSEPPIWDTFWMLEVSI